MARDLKRMLDRLAALREARRHLSDGEPARALERLEDGAVEGAKSAERLRRRTLEALAREAQRHLRRGEGEQAQAIFEELALHDPELAARVRQEELSAAGLTSLEGPSAPERATTSEHEQASTGQSSGAAFHLAIDEGGELYVHCGERLVLGHAHSESADLPVLADVGPSHVLLERRASLRDGPRWFVRPLSGESLRLGAKLVPAEGSEFTPGELLSLAPNCALRLIQPDAASSSAVLELLLGAECAGAPRVLLLAAGVAGRVRFGPASNSHVRVGAMTEDVSLVLAGDKLVLACQAGLEAEGEAPRPTVELACPPARRSWIQAGATRASEPPVCIGFSPVRRVSEGVG